VILDKQAAVVRGDRLGENGQCTFLLDKEERLWNEEQS
jgi:hypothetical protein